ncbi:FG-GAP-like repeat-containing protein [Rhodopirellula sp.]|nr:FG-GAP-like repeat-containing protein [Rhodopirellula sp.]
MKWIPCIFIIFALASTIGCNPEDPNTIKTRSGDPATAKDPTEKMLRAIRSNDWETAEQYSKQVLIANPDDPDLITKVALITARSGKEKEAAELLVSAAKVSGFRPASRVNDAVQGLINVGEIYEAVSLLEQSLEAFPDEHQQRRMLVGFLSELQRTEKLPEHLKVLFQSRNFDLQLLFATTDTSTRRMSVNTINTIFERNPNDYRVKFGNAFLHLYRREIPEAAKILEEIIDRHPDFAPAYATYGRVLAAQARWDQMPAWHDRAPAGCEDYSDYWIAMGDLSAENGNIDRAIRGYWEACMRNPSNSMAWSRLAINLQQIKGQPLGQSLGVSDQHIQLITEYSNQLQIFRERFNHFAAGTRTSQTEAINIARQLLEIGRPWAAEAWWAIASTLPEDLASDIEDTRNKIIQKLRVNPEWQAKQADVFQLDYSMIPLPNFESGITKKENVKTIPKSLSSDSLRLSDRSHEWGLKDYGKDNSPDDARVAPLIRSTGAGGGSVDFDLDGHSDLLIMNAAGSMLQLNSKPNNLLRNLGRRFADVSSLSNVADSSFGQGVAVGDYNEDGFPDLFFANLGPNKLLRNNGDGTYTDCSDLLSGDTEHAWSSSACFADINKDSITDLFVVNYCKPIPEIVDPCPNEAGEPGPCHPLKFPADIDMIFRGNGDGTFENVTEAWIGEPLPGRGLGIVAGKLASHASGILVANDMSRNAYYTQISGEVFGLSETAGVAGVALDGMSRPQASMGIASCDFDHDGDLDFYVTGFGREYNVYYEQVAPGLWKDETSRLGLVEPTVPLIGFGTQAIDIENDGVEEIIVTNGHIGDFDSPDVPDYDLPLQIFRRNGEGKFDLLDDDHWGEYFALPHVGRALWTTDVNRDGRNDVFITHMNEQIRLLLNESTDTNHRIGFRLTATRSSRDAVGAVVRFKVGEESRALWVLSGDGYFCSNEKTLIAGIYDQTAVTDVNVTWADGSIENFGDLPADSCYLLRQGDSEPFVLHQFD